MAAKLAHTNSDAGLEGGKHEGENGGLHGQKQGSRKRRHYKAGVAFRQTVSIYGAQVI